jgi:hypothetical protein
MRKTTDEILMRRYLLGDLPQEERVHLEDRYSTDTEVFEEVVAAENDLIDCYVRGELTEGERQKFETEFFKSAQRCERVEFARALSQIPALAKQAAPVRGLSIWKNVWTSLSVQQGAPQWALAAVVVVAGGSWLIVQNQRLRTDLQQALATQVELRGEQQTLRQHIAELEGNPDGLPPRNQQESEVAKLETPVGSEITLSLAPGMARSPGGPQNILTLTPTSSSVRLQLMLDRDEYMSYHIVLRTAEEEGNQIDRKKLRSRPVGKQMAVVLVLPSKLFQAKDYVATLTGNNGTPAEEDVEAYSFRVVRK